MILSIDTATDQASVTIAENGVVIGTLTNDNQKDHAAWIQMAINDLLQQKGIAMQQLQAIAITAGPGSYTGLRVGMATAKGLCFALQIPLITINTLQAMAYAVIDQLGSKVAHMEPPLCYCPMIDARRMEVFTAVYDEQLQEIISPKAMILDELSFKEELNDRSLICFGNGSFKWENVNRYPNVLFISEKIDIAKSLAKLAASLHLMQNFANLAYTEPVYLKEFYTYIKK
ncbi:tRNA (adenosine(37)-N6)-threonylcarbamoyltransferase complex dimerization subunit type 1 TsaB [Niastella yeongjuensis]|uniref:tRNA (Adenosine(37)-N6)-threonylcarbamoyltransferase complex dimerization subunit type 1 TsaB n=1 Tax=Niastella yeongjuensis TaxID=354355 RepID=A0A1V9EX89_9BACT|nr:tRNA (adenosine(37)-N6)-threonylcarbamoyltransferase complex dimerization subunit type 1 TsaB [Niastella yeongjuensis]OQP50750.1 tRNA (adenosine(37)-N6)-threonylcarbamoyltransferase complex dimerization subunit type 1 TsaB [Niastella yeongjuensis]SEN19718.1 tRNA threonylcarbamoyladenosine biosynthesis protein TsaB [Niastella yeongjuensis]